MSDERQVANLFLTGQRLFRLSIRVPLHHRRFHVCGDGPPPSGQIAKEPWGLEDREKLVP
jgi:hypothetical protein